VDEAARLLAGLAAAERGSGQREVPAPGAAAAGPAAALSRGA
jgi:hypothetical protein